MVELTNGCMWYAIYRPMYTAFFSNATFCYPSCSLKDDLLVAIRDLAKKGAYDYLIIEASGVAEPLPVGNVRYFFFFFFCFVLCLS
jgi:hypothetical protein